jgi:hypothetical protein
VKLPKKDRILHPIRVFPPEENDGFPFRHCRGGVTPPPFTEQDFPPLLLAPVPLLPGPQARLSLDRAKHKSEVRKPEKTLDSPFLLEIHLSCSDPACNQAILPFVRVPL